MWPSLKRRIRNEAQVSDRKDDRILIAVHFTFLGRQHLGQEKNPVNSTSSRVRQLNCLWLKDKLLQESVFGSYVFLMFTEDHWPLGAFFIGTALTGE